MLAPLAEIDPEHRDPCSRLTAETMYRNFIQKMKIEKEYFQQIEQAEWHRKSVDIL